MNIKLAVVGKLKKGYIKEGVSDFGKRLSKYLSVEIVEVKDEKPGAAGDLSAVKKEGERILSVIGEKSFVVCLDVGAQSFSSDELAEFMRIKKMERVKEMVFVIGGPLGISNSVLCRADFKLSLSKMTFPHEIARLILLEQLYRAEKILSGEPYHK